jgi:hypothetical protein
MTFGEYQQLVLRVRAIDASITEGRSSADDRLDELRGIVVVLRAGIADENRRLGELKTQLAGIGRA